MSDELADRVEAAAEALRTWERHDLLREYGPDGCVLPQNIKASENLDIVIRAALAAADRAGPAVAAPGMLRKALKPFAEVAEEWDGEPTELVVELMAYDDGMAPCLSVEDFRLARAALAAADRAGPDAISGPDISQREFDEMASSLQATPSADRVEAAARIIWIDFCKLGGSFNESVGTVAYEQCMATARAALAAADRAGADAITAARLAGWEEAREACAEKAWDTIEDIDQALANEVAAAIRNLKPGG